MINANKTHARLIRRERLKRLAIFSAIATIISLSLLEFYGVRDSVIQLQGKVINESFYPTGRGRGEILVYYLIVELDDGKVIRARATSSDFRKPGTPVRVAQTKSLLLGRQAYFLMSSQ